MPIKNYTSTIKPSDSLGKIQGLLAEHGARQISMEYDNNKPVSLTFVMNIGGLTVPFRLTVDVEGMLGAMKRDKKVPRSSCNHEQAERTAWKNKYEWLHIQLSEIESGQARMEQLLLGYAVAPTGNTIWEEVKSGQLQLEGKI